MKFGIDITGPDLHIGHAVNLWLYRALQEAGHKLVLVIGDYTTNVGDPSLGRRIFVPISPDVIAENAESYVRQVRAIVLEDPEVFEIRRNSEWLSGVDRDLLYRLAGGSRDRPLYPLLQGYDSVALRADLTIVGTDQIENERLGRTMQTAAGQAPQSIIASIVTPGLFGGPKQSKSLRNYIGLLHTPREKFGLALGVPDDLVGIYLRVYTILPLSEIESMERSNARPLTRMRLAFAKALVARFHGDAVADAEERWFKETFEKWESPGEVPIMTIPDGSTVFEVLRRCFSREELSNSEIDRLLKQGAVHFGNLRLKDPNIILTVPSEGMTLRIGRRRAIRLESSK